jgi:hypothetical protein
VGDAYALYYACGNPEALWIVDEAGHAGRAAWEPRSTIGASWVLQPAYDHDDVTGGSRHAAATVDHEVSPG